MFRPKFNTFAERTNLSSTQPNSDRNIASEKFIVQTERHWSSLHVCVYKIKRDIGRCWTLARIKFNKNWFRQRLGFGNFSSDNSYQIKYEFDRPRNLLWKYYNAVQSEYLRIVNYDYPFDLILIWLQSVQFAAFKWIYKWCLSTGCLLISSSVLSDR